MNICIVTERYPYKDNMEFVFVKKLVDEWAKMGHKCTVVTSFSIVTYLRKRIKYKPKHYRYDVGNGNYVDVYNPRTISVGKKQINGISVNFWIDSKVLMRKLKSLKIDFDFVYCHFFHTAICAFEYAYKNNIPFFVATGENVIHTPLKPNTHFSFSTFRNETTGVIAVSSKNREEALKLNLMNENKCKVFPNATDLSVFKIMDGDSCREKLNLNKKDFIICCVGYFCEHKGQNRVLEAIRKIGNPNIKVIFIGKPFTEKEVFTLEGPEILYKGTVENRELPLYLNASDIFCLPTQKEGCCNAIIEAMACGCPIISSDRSFNYDVLNQDNAILVDPDNVDEIKNAIIAFYDDADLRQKCSERVYEDSRRLGIRQRAESIMNFIVERLDKSII